MQPMSRYSAAVLTVRFPKQWVGTFSQSVKRLAVARRVRQRPRVDIISLRSMPYIPSVPSITMANTEKRRCLNPPWLLQKRIYAKVWYSGVYPARL